MTGGPTTIRVTAWTDDDQEVELQVPARWELCPRCRGCGVHVNPAIDGQGISPDEFRQDPDFEEAYFRGDYDVACERCAGEKVIAVVDRERATAEELEAYDAQVEAAREADAERDAERRAGC